MSASGEFGYLRSNLDRPSELHAADTPQSPRPPRPEPVGSPPRLKTVERLVMSGGARLAGEVTVGGAKNSALKLMAAALLATGESVISNVPRITAILIMSEVL